MFYRSRLLSCLFLFVVTVSASLRSASADEATTLPERVDAQQANWYTDYAVKRNQKNLPNPDEMLLNTDAEPNLDEGFAPLFNGKDLSGWTCKGGTCQFEAVDGTVVGTCVPGSDSTYLSTDRADYANFIFTCDIKWEVDGNTGVMFRAQSKNTVKKSGEKHEVVFGPQAEMEGIANDRGWSGGVYGQSCGGYFYPLWLKEHKEVRSAIKPDDWNRITIQAEGNVVKTWVNGIPAAHWIDDGTYSAGFFGLQIHKGDAGKVHFANVRVKELQ